MEGIEIVITPRLIAKIATFIIIIALAVLLVLHWGCNDCKECKPISNETAAEGSVNTNAGNQASSSAASATNTAKPANTTNTTASQGSSLPASCSNGLKDTDESDIDCGGNCGKCSEFRLCNVDKDCASGLFCYQHIKCMKPSCDDGVKNQDETHIDCGGKCKGYWWTGDSKCHDTPEPTNKLTAKLTVDVGASSLSGNAIINSVKMELENGFSKAMALTVTIYALTPSGRPVFSDQEGNNIAMTTVQLDSIPSMGKLTKTVSFANVTRKTLTGIEADDEFQLMFKFVDAEGDLIDTVTWTNK